MAIDPENPLVLPLVHASTTAFSHNPRKEISIYPHSVGKNTYLVAALHARNDARATFVGSLDMFSDDFMLGETWNAVTDKT